MSAQKKKTSKFMQPMSISAELAAVVGKGPMPRTEVTKKLWDYIKAHDLQDNKDRKLIVPDDKLKKIFGSKESIHMLEIPKAINAHLSQV